MTAESTANVRFFSGVKANILANFVGRFSSMGLAIICTPLYIHFLGIEAYGLIGFYITLQASLAVLEMGLKPTCVKELAHHSARGEEGIPIMRDTLRSLEALYWGVALLLGIFLSLAAPWIAERWLNNTSFTTDRLEHVLLLVAWVIALRWPMGLYNGALMGLQRQVLQNVLLVGLSAMNWVGSVLVLWLVQADIEHFFYWQLFVSIGMTASFGLVAWYSMPKRGVAGRFSTQRLKAILPFAIGTGSNAILGTILMQADKLILSSVLPLKQFGYYALASVMANAVAMLAEPVSNAVFPRFSQMIGAGAPPSSVSSLYHMSCQAVSVLIVPFALTMAFFPHEVLYAYTGKVEVADQAALVLSVLVIAKMLHASMLIPYALQLAYGWVRLSVYINVVSVCWIVPAVYVLSAKHGMVGAASAWLAVTLGYVFIGMPLMHKRILKGEWAQWVVRDVMSPLVAVAGFLVLLHWLGGAFPDARWVQGAILMGIGMVALSLACFSSHEVRRWALNLVPKRSEA